MIYNTSTPYMYIFIRKDLTVPQQIVQASHAALEAGFAYNQPAGSTYIVLISIKNQSDLTKVSDRLTSQGIDHQKFFEPDYDTGYTAIATRPLFGTEREPLKRYSLYTC